MNVFIAWIYLTLSFEEIFFTASKLEKPFLLCQQQKKKKAANEGHFRRLQAGSGHSVSGLGEPSHLGGIEDHFIMHLDLPQQGTNLSVGQSHEHYVVDAKQRHEKQCRFKQLPAQREKKRDSAVFCFDFDEMLMPLSKMSRWILNNYLYCCLAFSCPVFVSHSLVTRTCTMLTKRKKFTCRGTELL